MKARAVVATLLLAGCAVGPDYERPELDVPESFRGQPEPADPVSLGNLPWWSVFHDQALLGLLETALARNRDIKVAAARIAEARAQLGASRLAQLPQVNASASGGRSRASRAGLSTSGVDTEATLYSVGLDAAFEVDLWGRLSRATEAARATLLSSEFEKQTVITTLVSDVATAYFNLRSLDQQLESRSARSRRGRKASSSSIAGIAGESYQGLMSPARKPSSLKLKPRSPKSSGRSSLPRTSCASCSRRTPVRFHGAGVRSKRSFHRKCPPGYPRHCSNGDPIYSRPSTIWSRQTR